MLLLQNMISMRKENYQMFKKGTENFKLPQWDFDEHPDFLDDINPAFNVIDQNLHMAKADGADAIQRLNVLTPVVEGLTEDVTHAKHDITDLQTRITNVEHSDVATEARIVALEEHDKDLDRTLVGFDESNTVLSTTNKLTAYNVANTTGNTYLFDDTEHETNYRVGASVVKRRCRKFTTLAGQVGKVNLLDNLPTDIIPFAIKVLMNSEGSVHEVQGIKYVSAENALTVELETEATASIEWYVTFEYYK